jgi:hexosaminidase
LNHPILLPTPRQISFQDGVYRLESDHLVLIDDPQPQRLRFSATRLVEAVQARFGLQWEIHSGWAAAPGSVSLTLQINPQIAAQAQGYLLVVTPCGISLQAHDPAGVYYGICTLIQLLEESGIELPCLRIADWPDFQARGVMLDISRDKVPSMQSLYSLVDMLSGWKVNQLQLYTEHSFAYRLHPDVWKGISPMTGQEIMELDGFCQERFIELVPNQNSFGHLQHWLKLPRYHSLAEIDTKFTSPWGEMEGPFSLCPIDPGSLELIRSLYDELLPHFSSRMVNVGCDETADLGLGRSKAACEQRGRGRVYLDFLMQIYQDVRRRGFTMQFWADIIGEYPELLPELPKDLIALEWGYEADHPFDAHLAKFSAAGVPTYACGGTSSWNSLAGRTQNTLGNLLNAAENGQKYRSIGFLNTDWGDNGHWQVLPASYLGFAAGAAYSWALEANRQLDIPGVLNRFAFHDQAGVMGGLVYNLGNVYNLLGVDIYNASGLFTVLQMPLEALQLNPLLPRADFNVPLAALDQAAFELTLTKLGIPDAGLVLKEYDLTIRMLRHGCRRGLLAQNPEDVHAASLRSQLGKDLKELIEDFQAIWLTCNRPGGLTDSLSRFEPVLSDYRDKR